MKKNYFFNVTLTFLIIVNLTFVCFLFFHLGKNTLKTKQIDASFSDSGKIQIKVLEANTLTPIDNATVCIIETRHYETTNKFGATNTIDVPIVRNQNFDISLKRNWGELSILVYKNGYADELILNAVVFPGTTRIGFIVYLTPIINQSDKDYDLTIEKPNEAWIKTLIKLYKKSN